MKDAEGFDIRCEHSDWMIVDERDNKDFVCRRYATVGYHYCYCDDNCKDYIPIGRGQDVKN